MTFSRIIDIDPRWHLLTMAVGVVLLVLSVTDLLVRRYRLRRNLPLLTGWIIVGKLFQLLGISWMLVYSTWALFMIL